MNDDAHNSVVLNETGENTCKAYVPPPNHLIQHGIQIINQLTEQGNYARSRLYQSIKEMEETALAIQEYVEITSRNVQECMQFCSEAEEMHKVSAEHLRKLREHYQVKPINPK